MSAGFNSFTDFFGMASASLKLLHSDAGETHGNTEVSHTGGIDARHTGGILVNPVCKYMVVGDTTVSATLGAAWAATMSGGAMTKSGYMITRLAIDTRRRAFPVVTVVGTANEGADAINKWTVSVTVKSRARAQNLMGAISYGGSLDAVSLVASAEPVVIYQDNMPCASDIVHGALDVGGQCHALLGEAAPSPTSQFFSLGAPASCESCGHKTYSFNFRRAL